MARKRNKHLGGNPDTRPARKKYWNTSRLRENKVRRIMKATGMTKNEATLFWYAAKSPARTAGSMRSAIEHRQK